MLPLKLHLKNFGPYEDETVDFGTMRNAHIFLITGKTGSGKTTLFDAMTFALYGESASEGRKIESMRSDFADPNSQTEVTFSFKHQGLTYLIKRRPKQTLEKKNSNGTKVVAARGSLSIYKDGNEIDELTKLRDINIKIEDQLRLSRQQFVQIVMLPQGEFRRFLMSSSSDKEVILRNIFKTKNYQEWGVAVHERLKQQKQHHKDYQNMIISNLDQFQLNEVSDKWQSASLEQKLLFLNHYQEIAHDKLATEQKRLDDVKIKSAHYQNQLQLAKENNRQFDKLTELKNEHQKLLDQSKLHEQDKQKIDNLNWAKEQQLAYQQITTWQKDLTKQKELNNKNQRSIEKLKLDQSELLKKQTALSNVSDDIQAKQEQKVQLKQNRNRLIHREKIEQKVKMVQDTIKNLNQSSMEIDKKIKDNELQLTTQKTVFNKYPDLLSQKSNSAYQLERFQELQKQAHDLEHFSERNTIASKLIKDLRNDEKQLLLKEKTLSTKYSDLNQRWIKNQIKSLAQQLKPGTPCPVCGSLDHPSPAVGGAPAVSEADLKRLQKRLSAVKESIASNKTKITTQLKQNKLDQEDFERNLTKIKTALALNEGSLSKVTQLIKDKITVEQHKLDSIEQRLREAKDAEDTVKTLTNKVSDDQQKSEKINAKLNEQQELLTQYNANLVDTQDVISDRIQTVDDLDKVVAQLTKQLTEHETAVTENHDQLTKTNEKMASLKATLMASKQQIQKLVSDLDNGKQNLNQAIKEQLGKVDKGSFKKLLNQLPTLNELRTKFDHYKQQMQSVTVQLKSYQELVKNKHQVNTTDLLNNLSHLEQEKQNQENYYEKKQNMVITNDSLLKQIKINQSKISAQQSDYYQLQKLDEVMNGGGDSKLSLERYVLRAQLVEILEVANHHFQEFSSGRYAFQLHSQTGTYKKNTGLEIDVYDDTVGQTRSVHTLSGGESFIASLSLALALGEVIQNEAGGITIDTLFIDEGFGSLDHESLEIAMSSLSGLESSGRKIGIISHVSTLATTIPYQIQVKTGGQGQSHVKMIMPN